MPRTVFFSFHYQRDIFRVEQVKRHYVTKGSNAAAGFFNGSLEEEAKKKGNAVVKKMIDDGMVGSSVLCVLIGKETYTRRWVDYEILRAVDQKMGVFGIRIHQLRIPIQFSHDNPDGSDQMGPNPFRFLRFIDNGAGKYQPQIRYQAGWGDAPYQPTMNVTSVPSYFPQSSFGGFLFQERKQEVTLEPLFRVYDWVSDNGFQNFSQWLEKAAQQAGR